MASFEKAVAVILDEEGDGGGRAVRGDPGGATRWGITGLTLARAIAAGVPGLPSTVAELTRDQAQRIYWALWWAPQPYDDVLDQRVATKILSMDVNIGPTAIHLLQLALNSVLGDHLPGTTLFGPATLADVNRAPPEALLEALWRQQAEHYREWIAHNPADRERFRVGLMRRAAWPYPARAALVA